MAPPMLGCASAGSKHLRFVLTVLDDGDAANPRGDDALAIAEQVDI